MSAVARASSFVARTARGLGWRDVIGYGRIRIAEPMGLVSQSQTALPNSAQVVSQELEPALCPDERARLIRDGFINYSGVVVSSLVGLITVPLLLRGLGAEMYGVWIAAVSLVGMLQALDLGLSWSVTREVAATAENRDQAAPFVVTAGLLYFIIGILGCVIIATLGVRLSRSLGMDPLAHGLAPTVFALAGLNFLGIQISKFTTAILEGRRRFEIANALTVSSALLRGAGLIVLMLQGKGLIAVAFWYVCSGGIVSLAGLGVVARLEPLLWSRRLAPWDQLRYRLHFGLMSQINSGLTKVVWESAPILAGVMLGSAAVVPLYVGQRFPFALSLLHDRSAGVLFPAASEVSRTQRKRLSELVEAGMRSVLIIAVPGCLMLWVLAPAVMKAWMSADLPQAVRIMRISTVAVLADAFGLAAFQVLWGQGRVYRVTAILGAMTITGLSLTLLFLHLTGAPVGAAWAFLAAVGLGAVGSNYVFAGSGISVFRLLAASLKGMILPAIVATVVAEVLANILPASRFSVVLVTSVAILAYAGAFLWRGAREEERRTLVSAVNGLHHALKRVPTVRSAWRFAVAIAEVICDPWASSAAFDAEFTRRPDPWNFHCESEQRRFTSALQVLDCSGESCFSRAMEVGCAEGVFTEMLQSRCHSLLAADLSEVALQRAGQRCQSNASLRFQRWDLRTDDLPGRFDLVVAMCVLEYLRRRSDFRQSRQKLVDALKPGGHLLVSHARQSSIQENSRWGKWLLRDGKWINSFLAQHPALEIVRVDTGDKYINCLFRKRLNYTQRSQHSCEILSRPEPCC